MIPNLDEPLHNRPADPLTQSRSKAAARSTPARVGGVILERKRHFNKPDQQFQCERIWQNGERVVLRYVTDQAFQIAGATIPPGATTLGIYASGANHVFWKMLNPDGSLIGYLAHLCEPIQVEEDAVDYRDLMLDLWQPTGEQTRLLDEDDLEAAVAAGQIGQRAAEAVLARAVRLKSRFSSVIEEAEAALSFALAESATA